MTALVLRGLAFAHADGEPLFHSVDLHLEASSRKFVGLVGANGAGKTTLLRVLAGELAPERGTLSVLPLGSRVTLCRQRVDVLDAEVAAFSEERAKSAGRLRSMLRLDPAALSRFETLSPGEKKRWQIGAALFAEPDVLLLDEPTNHVDSEARALLDAALGRFASLAIVVSHDRAWLDATTRETLRIHGRRVTHHAASFSGARELWQASEERLRERRAELHAEVKRLRSAYRAVKREHEGAERSLSSSSRMKGPRDHDARGAMAKARAESAESSLGRAAGALAERVERVARERRAITIDEEFGRTITFRSEVSRQKVLASLEGDPIAVGDGTRVLLREPRLVVCSGDRIRIAGPNAAGKSTLLRELARLARARARDHEDGVFHLEQELTSAEGERLVLRVRKEAPEFRGRILSLVAALGLDPDRLLATATPSPGEARKLALARGLLSCSRGLFLDEPTNHLDLPSIERLEAALRGYEGAVVLVTHDEAFAAATTEKPRGASNPEEHATHRVVRIEGAELVF